MFKNLYDKQCGPESDCLSSQNYVPDSWLIQHLIFVQQLKFVYITLSFKNILVSLNPVGGEGFHNWPLDYKLLFMIA